MQVPDLARWSQNGVGIYVAPDNQSWFLPKDMYKLGDHTAKSFAKDGYAVTVLTLEGAEIYARTAVHAGKIPSVGGLDVDEIKNPEQRVSLLVEDDVRLVLDGYFWKYDRDARAFGCARAPKNLPKPLKTFFPH